MLFHYILFYNIIIKDILILKKKHLNRHLYVIINVLKHRSQLAYEEQRFQGSPMTDERASVVRWRFMPGMFSGWLLPSPARKQKRKGEVPGFHNPLWAPTQEPSTKYHLSKAPSPLKSAIMETKPLMWASGGHWPFQNPHGGRKEVSSTSCPLPSMWILWHAPQDKFKINKWTQKYFKR